MSLEFYEIRRFEYRVNILAVIVTKDPGLFVHGCDSLDCQMVPLKRVLVDGTVYGDESVGMRVARTMNHALATVNLREYDYVLRVDDDVFLPDNFLHANLLGNFDVVGFGYAQLFRVVPFLKVFGGKYPVALAEDSALLDGFRDAGYKVGKYIVAPVMLKRKRYSIREWVERGRSKHELGHSLFHALFDWKNKRQSTSVGFNSVFVVAGYLLARARKERVIRFRNGYGWNRMVANYLARRLLK